MVKFSKFNRKYTFNSSYKVLHGVLACSAGDGYGYPRVRASVVGARAVRLVGILVHVEIFSSFWISAARGRAIGQQPVVRLLLRSCSRKAKPNSCSASLFHHEIARRWRSWNTYSVSPYPLKKGKYINYADWVSSRTHFLGRAALWPQLEAGTQLLLTCTRGKSKYVDKH